LGDENISLDKSSKKYASRGGLKLEGALDHFGLDPKGAYAIDIGASSGGFTDCLLKRGAHHVIAVDSGSGQMVEGLRRDDRVTVIENFNARYMSPNDFEYVPNLAVMDVSFISAKLIINAVMTILADGGNFICLIKPQFEVGRSGLNKKGIVKNDSLRKNAVNDVLEFANCCGFKLLGIMESPILGGDGNTEYLAHFQK
jgi:23S rRNA (cytidine1920-2'-O)/16S rRNA (cytidine1409-2'-O)-methyltransferase